MCADVAAELENRGQVDLQYILPVLVRELVCWVSLLDAAAVQQDVDSMPVRKDGWYEG